MLSSLERLVPACLERDHAEALFALDDEVRAREELPLDAHKWSLCSHNFHLLFFQVTDDRFGIRMHSLGRLSARPGFKLGMDPEADFLAGRAASFRLFEFGTEGFLYRICEAANVGRLTAAQLDPIEGQCRGSELVLREQFRPVGHLGLWKEIFLSFSSVDK